MQVRKVLAGSLATLAVGATLALGAFATLDDYVTTSDSSLTSPWIVIGSPSSPSSQFAKDVVGAADIAAAVAGYATTDVSVAGAGTLNVNNGVGIATSTTKMYAGDYLGKTGLKSTLTKNDLPTLLASGTLQDLIGTEYSYDQYIVLGAGNSAGPQITFGKSGGDFTDPVVHVNTGISTNTPIANYSLVFSKMLNISSTNVDDSVVSMLGVDYTIGSDSEYEASSKKLVLFGSSNALILEEDADAEEITVGGTSYTVQVAGVSTATAALIKINGVLYSVTKGVSYTKQGLEFVVSDVYFFSKEGSKSSAKISFGSSKLTLEDGQPVKIGSDTTVEGTLVTLTGTENSGISKIDISMTAVDSSSDYITFTEPFVDPVFGKFKVALGVITPVTEEIVIDNSGTQYATLKFADYGGDEKTLTWISTPTTSWTADLNSTTTRKYVVVEGQEVALNDYVLLAPTQDSDFGHIMQYTTSSSVGSSGAYINLKDVMSDETTKIYLTGNGYTSAAFYIDGQQYHIINGSTAALRKFNITWGAGSSAGVVGTERTVFPLIKTKRGAFLTFVDNVKVTNATNLYVPGSTSAVSLTITATGANAGLASIVAGVLTYNLTNTTAATTTMQWEFKNITKTAGGTELISLAAAPGVLLYEEKGKDGTNTEVQNVAVFTVADGIGTGSVHKVAITTPTFSDAALVSDTKESDTSVTVYGDRYGLAVEHDTDSDGKLTITYPDDQVEYNIGVGSNPTFSTTAGGTSVKSAVMIKNPVTKLANEVSASSVSTHLILVGGPCANSLVASIADKITSTGENTFTCDAWTPTTGIIKEVEDAFATGYKALVVAGSNADDTRALAAKVMQGTLEYEE